MNSEFKTIKLFPNDVLAMSANYSSKNLNSLILHIIVCVCDDGVCSLTNKNLNQ